LPQKPAKESINEWIANSEEDLLIDPLVSHTPPETSLPFLTPQNCIVHCSVSCLSLVVCHSLLIRHRTHTR